MKTPRKLLFVAGIIASILLAFFAGRFQGTVRTVYDQNAGNLIWFIGLHDALERGDTDGAKELCGRAAAGHIDQVAKAKYKRDGQLLAYAYALPFTRTPTRKCADAALQSTFQYSEEHPSFLVEEQISTLESIIEE